IQQKTNIIEFSAALDKGTSSEGTTDSTITSTIGSSTVQVTTCIPSTCYGGKCEKRDGKLVCICPDGFQLQGVGCYAKPPVRNKIASVDNAEW
ncbi:hypothetical protein AVEN_256735-2-1, partial [Araneus ventricosus]